jgi:predicted lactoylglutathione lyase
MRVISIITLAVKNLAKSSMFYESLGFEKSKKSNDSITWFYTENTILALYPWNLLAEDIGVPGTGTGFRGVTLALNLQDKKKVDEFIEMVKSIEGGRVVKEPQTVFWGGYSSYFSDPDGHLWEVAWNPFTIVDEIGKLEIKE